MMKDKIIITAPAAPAINIPPCLKVTVPPTPRTENTTPIANKVLHNMLTYTCQCIKNCRKNHWTTTPKIYKLNLIIHQIDDALNLRRTENGTNIFNKI